MRDRECLCRAAVASTTTFWAGSLETIAHSRMLNPLEVPFRMGARGARMALNPSGSLGDESSQFGDRRELFLPAASNRSQPLTSKGLSN